MEHWWIILIVIGSLVMVSALIFAIFACVRVGAKSDQNNGDNDGFI